MRMQVKDLNRSIHDPIENSPVRRDPLLKSEFVDGSEAKAQKRADAEEAD